MASDRRNDPGACCRTPSAPPGPTSAAPDGSWNIRYFCIIAALAAGWWLVYSNLRPASHWLVVTALGLAPDSRPAAALEFFIYDTIKILMLLVALIYAVAWGRASLNVERVRDYLAGRGRGLGYLLGAIFGAVTPFCSCSSIPLFLGFTMARIPIGATMAFLITSPLVNEIAVVLLWGLLGWKFTIIYVLTGVLAGIGGGFFMDSIRAERWLQPFIIETMNHPPGQRMVGQSGEVGALTARQRHAFAYDEMTTIFKRIWKWVLIGVGIGAAIHGVTPENWFADHLGAENWWTVPVAVLIGIPLYSNVTGIVPIMESLLLKGLPIGTTMAFCMSAVAASIPEVVLLRQIMTLRLQAAFIGYLWAVFTLAGWLFNLLGPRLA